MPLECEWVGEQSQDLEGCGRTASHVVYERYVEAHLCAEHLAEENQDRDEVLGDLLQLSGFQLSIDFLPIREAATCNHAGNPLVGDATGECGKPATHAKVVVEQYFYCDIHAREAGCCPGGPRRRMAPP